VPSLLHDIGVSPDEETVYRAILAAPDPQNADDVADTTDLAARAIADALERLVSLGFVQRVPGVGECFAAVDPDLALSVVVSGQEWRLRDTLTRLARVRAAVPRIRRELVNGMTASPYSSAVHELVGAEVIAETCAEVALSAREHLCRLDFAPPDDEAADCQAADVRAMYPLALTQEAESFHTLTLRSAAGEAVRLVPSVPSRLVIADRRAVVSITTGRDNERALLFDNAPGLFHVGFDAMWDRALPFFGLGTDAPLALLAPDEMALLGLLAAGLKDKAIANHLRIGLRTVVRRISALMRQLGAETRFQAGLQAARRGLL
jgi:sugar-specific transcriptional regulator TrmB/DNA-binding CsgD family transcriptional regulator